MKPDWLSRRIAAKLDPSRPTWSRLGDDDLPTWLHTLLCLGIGAPIYVYLAFEGLKALASGRLEPITGPEIGSYMFGNSALTGAAATRGALSLLTLSLSFILLSVSFTRLEPQTPLGRFSKVASPWIMMAISIAISWKLGRLNG